MDSNNKLVKYKEETLFTKIKKKFLNLFKKNKEETIKQEISSQDNNINKKDFFEIYAKVKKHEIDLNTLDKKTLNKIIKMLDEEIALTSKMLEDNMNKISESITNMKMYTNEIHAVQKNP